MIEQLDLQDLGKHNMQNKIISKLKSKAMHITIKRIILLKLSITLLINNITHPNQGNSIV